MGLGAQTILNLTSHNPAHIYFTGRNVTAAETLIAKIHIHHPTAHLTFLQTDHASLSSVRDTAVRILATEPCIDILILNAGTMAAPNTSVDGYEIHFGVNYLSHALLVKLLLPVLERARERTGESARLVVVCAPAHKDVPPGGIQFERLKTSQKGLGPFGVWLRYSQSKLACALFAAELAKRHPEELTVVAVHPGVIYTGLFKKLGFGKRIWVKLSTFGQAVGVNEGAWNASWAATAEREGIVSGAYYIPVGERDGKELEKWRALRTRLWEWTENELERWVWEEGGGENNREAISGEQT